MVFGPTGKAFGDIVLVGGGKEYSFIRTDIPIQVLLGVGKKDFPEPCLRGHRIWVLLILDFLASGKTVEEILESYPQLTREDILACIAYRAEMSRERYVEIPVVSRP